MYESTFVLCSYVYVIISVIISTFEGTFVLISS